MIDKGIMALTFQKLYRSIDDALKFDNDNQYQDAYLEYLKSIEAASLFLQQQSSPNSNCQLNQGEIKKAMKLMKMCVQRVEALAEITSSSSSLSTSEDCLPSYNEVSSTSEPATSTPNSKSSSVELHNFDDDSWSEVVTDESTTSGLTEMDRNSQQSNSDSLSKSIASPVLSKLTQPTPMEMAIDKNKQLVQRYQKRIAQIKQPSNRVHAVLELQRRLVDNLKMAELEQRKVKEAQKKRQNEVIQKVRKKLKNVIQSNGEGLDVDGRIADLCRKCIYYEQEQEQTWPNDLRDCLALDINTTMVSYIVQETLTVSEYPISKWLQNRQKDVIQRLNQYLKPHATLLRQISHPNFHDSRLSESYEEWQGTPLASQLHDTVASVNDTMQVATEVLMLIYLDIDKLPEGKDICMAAIEQFLFKAIWGPLQRLFRLVHLEDEKSIKQIINKCKKNPLKILGLADDILPKFEEVSLKAMSHMQEITRLSCPSHKVDKLQQLCILLSDHNLVKTNQSLGADELIPMLTYIFVMCDAPNLIAEFNCMQNFMSESDMFGSKGYCISSMQTVLSFILTLDVSDEDST